MVTPCKILSTSWQVPHCELKEFRPKRSAYCICVFVINEGEKIRKQLHEMKQYASLIDIIVADGGSTDGSLSIDVLKESEVRTVLIKNGPGKLSAQMRMAFAYALNQGYKGVVVIDGNGKDDVSAIPKFINALEEGYDHVQGSRFVDGGEAVNTPLLRLLGVRLLHAPLISLSSGYHYTDTTNGFRAYSEKFLKDDRVRLFRDIFSGYELHYYLAIRAAELGFKITELPVRRSYPKHEKTPTKISSFRGNIQILITLSKAALHYYDPK